MLSWFYRTVLLNIKIVDNFLNAEDFNELCTLSVKLVKDDSMDVYNNYMGTNKIIIDDEEGMVFDADKMRVYNDTSWSVSVGTPV